MTRPIWTKVQNMCLVFRGTYSWDEEITWLASHWRSNSFADHLRRLVLAATVYHIWRFGSEVIFQSKPFVCSQLLKSIIVRKTTPIMDADQLTINHIDKNKICFCCLAFCFQQSGKKKNRTSVKLIFYYFSFILSVSIILK